jgi:hypothetical protein
MISQDGSGTSRPDGGGHTAHVGRGLDHIADENADQGGPNNVFGTKILDGVKQAAP